MRLRWRSPCAQPLNSTPNQRKPKFTILMADLNISNHRFASSTLSLSQAFSCLPNHQFANQWSYLSSTVAFKLYTTEMAGQLLSYREPCIQMASQAQSCHQSTTRQPIQTLSIADSTTPTHLPQSSKKVFAQKSHLYSSVKRLRPTRTFKTAAKPWKKCFHPLAKSNPIHLLKKPRIRVINRLEKGNM